MNLREQPKWQKARLVASWPVIAEARGKELWVQTRSRRTVCHVSAAPGRPPCTFDGEGFDTNVHDPSGTMFAFIEDIELLAEFTDVCVMQSWEEFINEPARSNRRP